MSKYWYKAFVTQGQGYILLDDCGDIRASAPDIEGIVLAKRDYGWGKIYTFVFDGKILKIGNKIK